LSLTPLLSPLQAESEIFTQSKQDVYGKKIYLKKDSSIWMRKGKIAVWHGRKLRVSSAIHVDKHGFYVKENELGKCLAKVNSIVSGMNSTSGFRHKSQGCRIEKKSWKCLICNKKYGSRDELYDHIWDKHNSHSSDDENDYDD
jgi:hypothetical protein